MRGFRMIKDENVFPWRLVLERNGHKTVLALFAYRGDADQYATTARAIYFGTITVEVNL